MEVRIVARHFDLTPALIEAIKTKMNFIFGHFAGLIDCMVTLSTGKFNKQQHQVEINVHIKNRAFCAKSSGNNMYSAINASAKSINRQILEHKNVITNHHHISPKRMNIMPDMQMQMSQMMEEEMDGGGKQIN